MVLIKVALDVKLYLDLLVAEHARRHLVLLPGRLFVFMCDYRMS